MGLQKRCEANGVEFVDVTSGHFDASTGLIDQRFVRKVNPDNHLADGPYAQLISKELRELWP
jgi:hypothetical protein